MEKNGSEKRNMGLEWLRIGSMFMIILLHSIDHSGLYETIINNMSQWWFQIYQLTIVGIVFLICSLIDYCRQRLFTVIKVDSLATKIEMKVKRRGY